MALQLDFVEHKPTRRKMRVVALICEPDDGGAEERVSIDDAKPWRDPYGVPSSQSFNYDPNE
jgi:hypothetical protein